MVWYGMPDRYCMADAATPGMARAGNRSMNTGTPAIPVTTDPGPDVERLREAMRRVAEVDGTSPVLTVYADVHPEAHGERPAARAELIVLRDRLRDILDEHPAHSPERMSLDEDVARVESLLRDGDLSGIAGLAAFAAARAGLWQTVTAAEPFETDACAGPIADLWQLARLVDDDAAAIVAVEDTSHTRLFAWRRGRLVEHPGPEDDPAEHERHDQGGWSQSRFQSHIDEQDRRFARRAAEAIDRFAEREHAHALLIGAEERAASALLQELPERTRALVVDVRHISRKARLEDVAAEVRPVFEALAERRSTDAADRAAAGHLAGDLGVLGTDSVRARLDAGAVAELVVLESAARSMDRWDRAALIRQATLTDARVVVVREHPLLEQHGGIGATLRFRA